MRFLRWLAPDHGPLEGADARIKAERALDDTVAQTPKYERLAEEIRAERQINGLSELFYRAHAPRSHG
jgi:hypothetical protein